MSNQRIIIRDEIKEILSLNQYKTILDIGPFLFIKLNDLFLDTYETLISFLRKLKYFLKSRKNSF